MTQAEFIEATEEVENYFDKEYTSEQIKIMYERLKTLSVERYKQLIRVIICNNKVLPKLADFIEINKNEVYIKNNNTKKTECEKCNGTGYLIYIKIIRNGDDDRLKYQYACVCDCGNAKQYKRLGSIGHKV